MTSVSKNMYIDKLDDRVNEYNKMNTYKTIKMKPVDVRTSTYIDCEVENNDKNPKFKIGDHVRILKYKNIFAKGYTPNWSEDVFVIKNVKHFVPWAFILQDINGEDIVGGFYEKELQKTNQTELKK